MNLLDDREGRDNLKEGRTTAIKGLVDTAD